MITILLMQCKLIKLKKPDKKRIVVFRTLFGFKIKNKKYSGLVEKTNSKWFGKGTLIVPIEGYKKIEGYLRSKKITFRIIDFWTDEKIIRPW